MSVSKTQVAFIHGRPAPHYMHAKIADSINSDFYLVDQYMRWLDLEKPFYYKYLSWVVNAFLFPNKKKYKVFLTEQPHFPPVIMEKAGLLGKNQKVAGLLAGEALFFLYSNYYSKSTTAATKKLLENYDALFCMGNMAAQLVDKLLGESAPQKYVVFNGVPNQRVVSLKKVKPNLESRNILFIGNGPSKHREWYKGLDIIVEAFKLVLKEQNNAKLIIIGEWEGSDIKRQLENELQYKNHILFLGKTNNLEEIMASCSLYLHCSRGDAYPTTVLEAMAGGLPTIISEWTGTREVVEQVDTRLIVPLNIEEIEQKIQWYFELNTIDKERLSQMGRNVVQNYTEENAIHHFKTAFKQMEADLGI